MILYDPVLMESFMEKLGEQLAQMSAATVSTLLQTPFVQHAFSIFAVAAWSVAGSFSCRSEMHTGLHSSHIISLSLRQGNDDCLSLLAALDLDAEFYMYSFSE